ncbi:2-octaprenyl-6-methoxyphenyl hydroxylase, partial [Pantoea agglomerans]
VTLRCPARVIEANRHEQPVEVTLDPGELLSGKLLVAAEGTRSALAASGGLQWPRAASDQLAVIANGSTALPPQGRACERLTAHG